MDPDATTIFLAKVDPSSSSSSIIDEAKGPLELFSWLQLQQSDDGPPRTAIKSNPPTSKCARDLAPGDVILDHGAPCRVLHFPGPADADGKLLLKVWNIYNNEAIDVSAGVDEEVTMVATRVTRYYVVCLFFPSPFPLASFVQSYDARTFPGRLAAAARVRANEVLLSLKQNVAPAQVVPGTLVLRKQEGGSEDNPDLVFDMPGGCKLGDSLQTFFNTARLFRMPVSESRTL